MKTLVGIISLVGGVAALGLFLYYLNAYKDLSLARSVAFISLGINSLIFVFSVRTLTLPFWKENPLKNKWLNVAVFAGIGLQFLPFVIPTLGRFLDLSFPGVEAIAIVFVVSITTFCVIEIIKGVFRRHIEWFEH